MGLPGSIEASANYKIMKDNGSTTVPSNSNSANQNDRLIAGGHSQIPEFQISVPTSLQINQLNFYTEVNPNNQPTSNFTRTGNIDEDYDT